MKDKYDELRAAIAAVRKVNKGLLRVLPQWPEGWGEPQHSSDRFAAASPVHNPPQVKENVAAFFREHGKEGEEAVAAFLDALARFTFDEFPRNWPEVWYMVQSSREIQWRLRRHFPDNAFFDRVFHEEVAFFKPLMPTARKERSRAYWELLRKVAGYSRRVLAQMVENAVRSLEGERLQPVCLAEFGDGALRKIAEAMGGEARRPRRSGRTGGTAEQARWHRTGGEGRRGPQTAFMAKQRKVFLEYLKVRPETASVSRITRARECWSIHRKEWDAAAKKGIGYADYKALSRAKLM
ncbi:MAG: hypothetical protein KBT68_01800 [bacterium]|nr:hypothetical protein [Candidatus Colisoma equi]